MPWATFFDQPYIGVQQAHSLAWLGDHGRAAGGFRTAIERLQAGYHRDRGVYVAREAIAHAGMGEAEHAAALGLQALAVGNETHSARIFSELVTLQACLGQCEGAPNVTDFRTAMDATVMREA